MARVDVDLAGTLWANDSKNPKEYFEIESVVSSVQSGLVTANGVIRPVNSLFNDQTTLLCQVGIGTLEAELFKDGYELHVRDAQLVGRTLAIGIMTYEVTCVNPDFSTQTVHIEIVSQLTGNMTPLQLPLGKAYAELVKKGWSLLHDLNNLNGLSTSIGPSSNNTVLSNTVMPQSTAGIPNPANQAQNPSGGFYATSFQAIQAAINAAAQSATQYSPWAMVGNKMSVSPTGAIHCDTGSTPAEVPVCKCGAKKCNYADYTRFHSDWCPVYKA